MYQPALRPEQIKALYYLRLKLGRAMTELVREAVEVYVQDFGGSDELIPPSDRCDRFHLSREGGYRGGVAPTSAPPISHPFQDPAEGHRRRVSGPRSTECGKFPAPADFPGAQ